MRFSKAARERWKAATTFERQREFAWEFRMAMEDSKGGYVYPGRETHFYALWVSGDANGHNVIARDEKLSDAMLHVVRHIQTGVTWG